MPLVLVGAELWIACELARAFRNENLWIGTCFQE